MTIALFIVLGVIAWLLSGILAAFIFNKMYYVKNPTSSVAMVYNDDEILVCTLFGSLSLIASLGYLVGQTVAHVAKHLFHNDPEGWKRFYGIRRRRNYNY